jgi:hypothetical protein
MGLSGLLSYAVMVVDMKLLVAKRAFGVGRGLAAAVASSAASAAVEDEKTTYKQHAR